MWDYTLVLPSVLVMAIFACYYFARPRLPIRLNRTFLCLLAATALTTMLDVLGSYLSEHYASYPAELVRIAGVLYFSFFVICPFLFYRFTLEALHRRTRRNSAAAWLFGIVVIVSLGLIVSSPWTELVFIIDETGYHYGPLYNSIHVCYLFYLLLSVLLAFRSRARLSRYEFISVLGYNCVLLAGLVLRLLLPHYLLVNTIYALAMIIIFLSFENPDLYLSDRGTAFNHRGFNEVLEELVAGKAPYRILGFVLRDYNDERGIYGGGQMDQGIAMISQYLDQTYPTYTSFYLRSGCFAVVGPETMNWNWIRGDIRERFQHPWEADEADLYLDVAFVQMDSGSGLTGVDQILNTLLIALDRAAQSVDAEGNPIEMDAIQNIEQQVAVKRSLETALEQNSVEVFLQPLVDAKTHRLVAAEALARIRDAEGNLISPSVFIPIAEKNGHINLMGEQVFQKTCRFISEHDMNRLGLQWINMNLSPIQCMKKDLADWFQSVLNDCSVSARFIHLEITEQSMVDYVMVQNQLQSLQKSGFRFALDDFGSGYSNLTRIKHYPFTNIKLDMEVVWDYFRDRDSLLPTLVQSFKNMGFSITAEGVESAEMAETMTAIGCDYLQGFYFSRPIPMAEFLRKYGNGRA